MLNLKPNENVLDVGCGIGGSAFLMTQVHTLLLYTRCRQCKLNTRTVHLYLLIPVLRVTSKSL